MAMRAEGSAAAGRGLSAVGLLTHRRYRAGVRGRAGTEGRGGLRWRTGCGGIQGFLLDLDDGRLAQAGFVGLLATADPEQMPGPDQVPDQQQVDEERAHPQPGDLDG